MDQIYWLQQPAEPAGAPRRWSYSGLALWRQCPRRWWLQNSGYANAPGGSYPVIFGAAAVQGRLVHAALEAERKWLRDGPAASSFQPRHFLKQALRELLDGEVAGNPRLDRGRLEAAVSLDDCLAKFFALSQGPGAGPRTAQPQAAAGRPDGPPRNAQEYWVEVEDPPLAGRIDEVREGILIDFKTGEEDLEAHAEQLRLYAVLWWLRFGEPPAGLEVRYPGAVHFLPAPDADNLRPMVQALKKELAAICAAVTKSPPEARHDPERCRLCPVRQLCGEYWQASETRPLRSLHVLDQGSAAALPIRDVELIRLPEHWTPGKAFIGLAEASGIGPVWVTLSQKLCPQEGSPIASSVRLLQVLLLSQADGVEVRAINSTEAFWKV
jgi:hypothetical protein